MAERRGDARKIEENSNKPTEIGRWLTGCGMPRHGVSDLTARDDNCLLLVKVNADATARPRQDCAHPGAATLGSSYLLRFQFEAEWITYDYIASEQRTPTSSGRTSMRNPLVNASARSDQPVTTIEPIHPSHPINARLKVLKPIKSEHHLHNPLPTLRGVPTRRGSARRLTITHRRRCNPPLLPSFLICRLALALHARSRSWNTYRRDAHRSTVRPTRELARRCWGGKERDAAGVCRTGGGERRNGAERRSGIVHDWNGVLVGWPGKAGFGVDA